jgi:MFS family permease
MTSLKKTLSVSMAAAMLAAAVLATATPAEAQRWRGHHRGYGGGGALAAGVIGGLALGALAAGAARAEPVDECWEERRPVYNRAGQVVGSRIVPVCN